MGGKHNRSINYDAYVIIPKNRTTTFDDRAEQQSSLNSIITNGYWVTKDGVDMEKLVQYNDSCLPIRVLNDPTGTDLGDDWSIASPVTEIGFAAIVRWWPKKWFINSDGSLPSMVTIHYGGIDINCTVLNPDSETVGKSFEDTIISQDHDAMTSAIDLSIDKLKKENNMFKRKLTVQEEQNAIPEEEIKVVDAPRTEEEELPENTFTEAKKEDETMAEGTTETTTTEVAETTTAKKSNKGATVLKVLGVLGVAAGLGFGIYKFVTRGAESAAE